jgi:transcriptional regulator of NAD metabolism
MQKAVEEFTRTIAQLKSYGISIDVDLNEDTLKAKLQQVFDRIREKLHSA